MALSVTGPLVRLPCRLRDALHFTAAVCAVDTSNCRGSASNAEAVERRMLHLCKPVGPHRPSSESVRSSAELRDSRSAGSPRDETSCEYLGLPPRGVLCAIRTAIVEGSRTSALWHEAVD